MSQSLMLFLVLKHLKINNENEYGELNEHRIKFDIIQKRNIWSKKFLNLPDNALEFNATFWFQILICLFVEVLKTAKEIWSYDARAHLVLNCLNAF